MQIGGVTFGGLASGLDTRALVDAILKAERRPVERLQTRQGRLRAEQSALDEMRSKLSGFLNTLKDLTTQNAFQGRVTTVSDETAFGASAAPGAELGAFSVEVLALATAHKVKSAGFGSATDPLVSDGTITIQSGSNDPIAIDVSAAAGNNSLNAVRDAINDAGAGVRASILFDGTAHRLIVRAEESGLANALSISDSTSLGLDEPGSLVTAAADAHIQVDGIDVTDSDNTISNVVQGVTLNLLDLTSEPVTLQVADDVDGVVEAVEKLAASYNEAMRFFNSQFDRSNPGALAGDSFARRQQLTLQSLITAGVDGIPDGGIRSLASIGVEFDGRTGELSVDTAELRELLEERFDEVGRLFGSSGAATDARIQFIGATSATVTGDYAVEITQAAEQATVVGSKKIKPGGIKNNENLTITVGSDSVVVALLKNDTIGIIVSKVNAALSAAGVGASASDDAGKLRLTTGGHGSAVAIEVTSSLADPGNGNQTGFGLTPTTDSGVDVAGSLGGVAGTGAGLLLTGAAGGDAAGLTVKVTATAADIAATGGDFGSVTYGSGLADRIVGQLSAVTRFGDGHIETNRKTLDGQLRRLADEISRIEERLVEREARLVRAFAAAEEAIATLQAQQSQLGSFFPR